MAVGGEQLAAGGFRHPLIALWGPVVLTAVAFVGLYEAGDAGDAGLWVVLSVLAGAGLAAQLTASWLTPDANARRIVAGTGVQILSVTAVIYVIGWGATLCIGYVFVLERSLQLVGSRVWRPMLVWTLIGVALGQTAIAFSIVPTYVAEPAVHGVAFLSVLGTAFVLRLVGEKTEQQEESVAQLDAGRASFRSLFADNPHPMWVYDAETLAFLEVNEAAIERYGFSRDEFLALGIDDVVERVEAIGRELPAETSTRAGTRHRLRDGTIIDVEVSAHPLTFRDHRAVLAAMHDVTERNALEAVLRHQAEHDPLTGAATRTALLQHIDRVLDDEERAPVVAVEVFDIDHFKLVNDSLGAEAADALLCMVVERLARRVERGEILARLGSDNLAVFMVAADETALHARAEALRTTLAQPFTVASQPLYVSASAGLATTTERTTAAELLRRADDAMHRAKARGGNRLELFDEEAELAPGTRLGLVRDLRTMLERGQLAVHYQPIVALADGEIVAAEALARCGAPLSVPPSVFIPLAEEAGLIGVLGEQVMATAIGQAAHWPDIRVAVNVSPRQLLDPQFPDRVLALLRVAQMPPSRLIVEVTETVLVEDSVLPVQSLERLAAEGVSLAIDDLGSGYAGLQYLQRFPVREIKIDRSLVDRLDERPERCAVTRALIEMARELGIDVIAEGVERPEERDTLVALGCRYAQGFLFAVPSPAQAFATTLGITATRAGDPDDSAGDPFGDPAGDAFGARAGDPAHDTSDDLMESRR